MKFAALTLLAAAPLAAFAEGDCGTTIFDIVKENSQFDTLQLALELTGLDDVLDGDGSFTVFAPTDKAFENLPSGVLDALVDNTNALTDILLYHVVSSKAFSDDLKDGQQIKTIVGRTVKVDIESDGDIEINDANVIDADIEACNGVIHVIDKVLIPSIKDVGDCDKHDKCGFCVGDCDSDHDCSDGRQCIKRSSHEFEDVPFCKGGSKDESSTDYCSWEI
jgi:uncharacterized surface protein with fasciclin (FAS1) repeats